ncbi:hypothetical protein GCM10025857_18290 [Alicyclobacillus contaminans]|nr:hypothetical protein GCM10025857_18290 [Alicyclobacillus contaminans]
MDGNHYYSTNPSSDRRPGQISVRVRGVSLTLHTDAGVFSRRGLDFGTRLLLETVDLDAAREVVDLGCGYGVVAAVLGRVYPETHWTLVDVNARAIELAEQNTRHLGDRRLVVQSDGFAELPGLMVDAVLLNPPSGRGKP